MSRKRIVLAFSVAFAVFSAAIGYTASANYPSGNDNNSRKKPGSAPVSITAAKKSKSKKSRRGDESKKSKKSDNAADRKDKIIRIDPNADQTPRGPISQTAESFAVSPELKTNPEIMKGTPPFDGEIEFPDDKQNNKVKVERTLPGAWLADSALNDPVATRSIATAASLAPQTMPAPSLSFDGILSNDLLNSFLTTSMPPDTVGDVGPNHYVQATNFGVFRVFNKATGAPLTGTAKISSVFVGFPANHPCRTNDKGDPVINYDPMADRWLVSQFQIAQSPMGQCIAVSQTGDPTGSWYAYYFLDPNGNFPDYPHWGVWTDGYYLATHEFSNVTDAYVQGGFFVFNREKMLTGDPSANYVYFGRAASYGHLPADIDGYMPPATGTPAMFFEVNAGEYGGTDSLLNYEFVPNFANPASSTLTVKPAVAVASFDPRDPNVEFSERADIEQPSPATASHNLDAAGGQLMFRVAYRNLGTILAPINSYVMNWTVNVSGAVPNTAENYQAAPRWTELRRSGAGALAIFDEGTHAPDSPSGSGRNRWMGSIAQDHLGNLALGFSRSGPGVTEFPDIVWAGRTGGQTPAGMMNEGEATMFASTGVQQSTSSRWGDYSSMTVDPADDCTFWYTQLYRHAAYNGDNNSNPFKWSTRIGKFKFPACTAQPKGQISANVTYCGSGAPVSNARVTAVAGNFFRLTDSGGHLVSNIVAAPGVYTVTAAKGLFAPSSPAAVTVINGNTTNVNLCLNGIAITAAAAAITSESCALNNSADPGELITVNLPLQNIEGNSTSNLAATLLPTGGVMLPSAPQSYGVLTVGGTATRSFSFTVDPNAVPGSTITLTLALADGALNLGTVTYTLPVGGVAGAAQNYDYSGSETAIPDGIQSGVNTTLDVSGLTGNIQDLNFVITGTSAASPGIEHTWIGDLQVKLTSPAGTTVTLIQNINDDIGGNGNCSSNNVFNTVLDDSAVNSIDQICPGDTNAGPLTGTFKPQNPLSAFNGQNPNGTWTLNVSDSFGTDIGLLRGYRLVITPLTPACTGKSVGGTVNYGTNLSKLVSNVKMKAAGTSSYFVSTNASGVYTLSGLVGGGSYTITPSKTGSANNISAADATLVLRCVANLAACTLTANQQKAGDANGDGKLSAVDATMILRYAAAQGATNQTGQVGDWKFSPDLNVYSPLDNSLSSENFTAFLIGELNGNWNSDATLAEETNNGGKKETK